MSSRLRPVIVEGARVNNLKGVDLILDFGTMVAFVGPSGSGKSSMAFDVLYAEAHNQGWARGVSRVFRHGRSLYSVQGLPAMTVGIEQQLGAPSKLQGIGRSTGLLQAIVAERRIAASFCKRCGGNGFVRDIRWDRVVRRPDCAVTKGAFTPVVKKIAMFDAKWWARYCRAADIKPATPYARLPKAAQEMLRGGGEGFQGFEVGLSGWNPNGNGVKDDEKAEVDFYLDSIPCSACDGVGLATNGKSWSRVSIGDLISKRILKTDAWGRRWLRETGLLDLRLSQRADTVPSTQERMLRFFVAANGIVNASLLIFDEPCAGLTCKEAKALAGLLASLADNGHIVVVVDHMPQVIDVATRVVAFGPQAGTNGGMVVFDGKPCDYHPLVVPKNGTPTDPPQTDRRSQTHLTAVLRDWFGCTKDIELSIPLLQMVCIAGRAGSGKSAYTEGVFAVTDKSPVAWRGRTHLVNRKGFDRVRRPHFISAEPIGRHPGSTPGTYMGVWEHIRSIFCEANSGRGKRLTPLHFSFNSARGWCSGCRGRGWVGEETFDKCPECNGARFNSNILKCRVFGRTIADINLMTVQEAREFFQDYPRVTRRLDYLLQIGLGYITLGQPSNSLSGGESQRLRIASLLCKRLGDRSLYILDNPTRGLDSASIPSLVSALRSLVEHNNSLVVAENRPEVLNAADWIILLDKPKAEAFSLDVAFAGQPDKCPSDVWSRVLGANPTSRNSTPPTSRELPNSVDRTS